MQQRPPVPDPHRTLEPLTIELFRHSGKNVEQSSAGSDVIITTFITIIL